MDNGEKICLFHLHINQTFIRIIHTTIVIILYKKYEQFIRPYLFGGYLHNNISIHSIIVIYLILVPSC